MRCFSSPSISSRPVGSPLRVELDRWMCCPVLFAHRADEGVPFPRRKLVAVVERQAGHRDCRHPEYDRLLEARRREAFADPGAVVVAAEGHPRPAVVLPGLDAIQFVAALRSFLARPQFAVDGIERQPERIAMAERVDLRLVSSGLDERVVRRHACRRRGSGESCRCATPGPAPLAGCCDRRAIHRAVQLLSNARREP